MSADRERPLSPGMKRLLVAALAGGRSPSGAGEGRQLEALVARGLMRFAEFAECRGFDPYVLTLRGRSIAEGLES